MVYLLEIGAFCPFFRDKNKRYANQNMESKKYAPENDNPGTYQIGNAL